MNFKLFVYLFDICAKRHPDELVTEFFPELLINTVTHCTMKDVKRDGDYLGIHNELLFSNQNGHAMYTVKDIYHFKWIEIPEKCITKMLGDDLI